MTRLKKAIAGIGIVGAGLGALTLGANTWIARAQETPKLSTTAVPAHPPAPPVFVKSPLVDPADGPGIQTHAPIIRVYQDSLAWFGENRDNATLLSMGKILGDDYFIHPISDCATGIPAGTRVVFFSSNGSGDPGAASSQNLAACQTALNAFLAAGGTLIVDMGDNLDPGGFMAPGAVGTPSLVFPFPACDDATLTTPGATGADGLLGTADDHPIVKGPDGIAGTADDLTNTNIDMAFSCYVAHGNLMDGITLPSAPSAQTTALMTAEFDGVQKPIVAEYCHGRGRVILDTVTKEFEAHQGPGGTGTGPTFFMRNLFTYALSDASSCVIDVHLDIKPRSCPNPMTTRDKGTVPVAILGTANLDVTHIDLTSIQLEGVSPIRSTISDVAAPFSPAIGKSDCLDCTTRGPDGFADLSLKFDAQALIAALQPVTDGECRVVKLTGNLLPAFGGYSIQGEDVVRIQVR